MIRVPTPNDPLLGVFRSYPRSLAEAFPVSEGASDGVTVYRRPASPRLDRACWFVGVMLFVLFAWACMAVPG